MIKPIKPRKKHAREHAVLIVKPHNIECQTNEWTNQFIMKAFQRGTAEYSPYPTKSPEFGRNMGILKFLNDEKCKKYEHIFFLDDDSPPVDDFAIEFLRSMNKPVAAGITPIVRVKEKTLTCHWSSVVLNDDGKMAHIPPDKLPKHPFKAHRVGGTCLLVARRVLEKLNPPFQKTTFNELCTDVALSEDVYFSDRIREAGFDIWVHPRVQCHHWHNFDLLDIFAILRQTKNVVAAENSA